MLVPGIAGDSSLFYCQNLAYACIRNDFDFVIINYQGLGPIPLTKPYIYNAADTQDLAEVIESLYNDLACQGEGKNRKQTRRLIGCGISMGASVLGLYAVHAGTKNRLDACVGVGCHYDSAKALDNLSTKYLGFYDYFLGFFIK